MATNQEAQLVGVKVALRGPIPHGGSFFTTLDDTTIDHLIADGWTVQRTWEVWNGPEGFFSVDVSTQFDLVPVTLSCGHTGNVKRWNRDQHYRKGAKNFCPVCGLNGTVR